MRPRSKANGAIIVSIAGLALAGATLLDDGRPVAVPMAPAATAAPAPAPAVQAAAPATPVQADPAATASAFVIKRILPIEGPIRYGEWHWDEAGAPAQGQLIITVDLEARVLSVFRDGYEIGATAVLLGTQEKPTPLGVFPITQKKERHVSNLYGAPMPFMQRLTNDGISIHASNVQNGYASHGCIGTPMEFARKLFAATKMGDIVIITRGKQVGLGDPLIAG